MAAKFREAGGVALVLVGLAGLVLPVIPGIALIAAGVAVLGADHALVRPLRSWLVTRRLRNKGWRKAAKRNEE